MPLPSLKFPLFKVKMPSTGNEVTFRPMLVSEDKILLVAKESNDPTDIFSSIKQVVGNCLLDKNLINSMTLFDIEYLFIKLRGVSVSNVIEVSYKDNEDGKMYNFDIDIDKDINMKYPESIDSAIIFENDRNKIEIILKYPQASLYDDKAFLNTSTGNFFESLVYKCIDKLTVNGERVEFTAEEFRQWAETLPLDIYNKIRNYFENLPTLYCELNYTNAKGNQRKIVLSTLEDFFTLR